ncbi:MAG: hypothetical protein ABSE56_01165 [Bryobacteraceae bacterium]|jgi:hypothetical protein
MRRLVAFAILPVLALGAGDKKGKSPPAPRAEVLELAVKRTTERTVEIDGRVRSCGVKPIQHLVLRFKVLSPDGDVLTTQTGAISPEVLEPGEEAEFHWRMRDHARAVALRVEASAPNEPELSLVRPGPYRIE